MDWAKLAQCAFASVHCSNVFVNSAVQSYNTMHFVHGYILVNGNWRVQDTQTAVASSLTGNGLEAYVENYCWITKVHLVC